MTLRYIRKHLTRLCGAMAVGVLAWISLSEWFVHRQEERIAAWCESVGARVAFYYFGPDWIPKSIQSRLELLDRVAVIEFRGTSVTDAQLHNLQGLSSVEMLGLEGTHVTDNGLHYLEKLATIEWLDLRSTNVSDAGTERLKGFTKLEWLGLNDTKVSSGGRASLRRVLPNCKIDPDP